MINVRTTILKLVIFLWKYELIWVGLLQQDWLELLKVFLLIFYEENSRTDSMTLAALNSENSVTLTGWSSWTRFPFGDRQDATCIDGSTKRRRFFKCWKSLRIHQNKIIVSDCPFDFLCKCNVKSFVLIATELLTQAAFSAIIASLRWSWAKIFPKTLLSISTILTYTLAWV
jgi:hypothetical protein